MPARRALAMRSITWQSASILIVAGTVFSFALIAMAADSPRFIEKPSLKFDEVHARLEVAFEVSDPCDIEVALVDPKSHKIVRHLAAGVLGPKPPSPLRADTLRQVIPWDGRDDYGARIEHPETLQTRVRAGMKVALETIAGGDPYAYYSEEMGDSDHSPWCIGGLDAKADGYVYVWGHSSNLGPPALRKYNANGNYVQTLFPLPAGKPIEAMEGWGIHTRPDGTYTPIFNALIDPSMTTTFLDSNLRMARLLPTAEQDRLLFMRSGSKAGSFDLLSIHTDGSIATKPEEQLLGPLVQNPPFNFDPIEPNSHIVHSVFGPIFVAPADNGQSFFLSGIYTATARYGSIQKFTMEDFWRDGQVWKVDRATKSAKVFFALDKETIPIDKQARVAAYGGGSSYSAIHGVATDAEGNVFICDRLNKRIVILDKQGKQLREIPVEHPDAIAVSAKDSALYLTTRFGDYHRHGAVHLLKFADWRKDNEPVERLEIAKTGYTQEYTHTQLAVCETADGTNVWVAWTQMPVRVYRDESNGLKLIKDFYHVDGAQRCLGFDRMQVDLHTEDAYVLDSHDTVWKVTNWESPRFEKLPLRTASIAIDARRRHLYIRTLSDGAQSNSVGKIARYHLDREDYPPANFGDTDTNRVTESMHYEWCFEGNSDKGMAIAPNGNLAVAGKAQDGLRIFAGSESQVPWPALKLADLPNNAGGVRFDLAGNLYVGFVDSMPQEALPGFEGDRLWSQMGRIHKFTPTGSLESELFPQAPAEPARSYDIPYGAFETNCVTRSPRFGVDGYGRIYYPTNIVPRVSIIDNAGNEILHFGTYGNRDSLGGLPGDLVPTNDIPLAFPNAVDATDDYIYVADMVNQRILRLRKQYTLQAVSGSN